MRFKRIVDASIETLVEAARAGLPKTFKRGSSVGRVVLLSVKASLRDPESLKEAFTDFGVVRGRGE
ncbi:hypothetical protein GCM10027598_84070 [Amycolatopsis oliviviridis]|uniref:Uncharacterized protein n=1 Tax=Amycolatopsis oliviviridis TaxID=1471590 RepID=A0ABQ3LD04_9PSEU|nr:hypothetical protein GCM10017790_13970 [Amycolatopsis oliviviridis]